MSMSPNGVKINLRIAASCALIALVAMPAAKADYISPNIKDRGHEYTDEKPHSEIYGTDQGARLVESSELRMVVDGLIRDHQWDLAVKKARKAVQLDPGYPENHLLLARALVGKLYGEKGAIDEKLLAECIREWQLIRWHDADPCNQAEAKGICWQLGRISRTLEKDRQLKAKMEEKKRLAEALAKKADELNRPATVSSDTEKVATPASVSTAAADTAHTAEATAHAAAATGSTGKTLNDVQTQLAVKKKRWLLF